MCRKRTTSTGEKAGKKGPMHAHAHDLFGELSIVQGYHVNQRDGKTGESGRT